MRERGAGLGGGKVTRGVREKKLGDKKKPGWGKEAKQKVEVTRSEWRRRDKEEERSRWWRGEKG